jgi:hypothetical protein
MNKKIFAIGLSFFIIFALHAENFNGEKISKEELATFQNKAVDITSILEKPYKVYSIHYKPDEEPSAAFLEIYPWIKDRYLLVIEIDKNIYAAKYFKGYMEFQPVKNIEFNKNEYVFKIIESSTPKESDYAFGKTESYFYYKNGLLTCIFQSVLESDSDDGFLKAETRIFRRNDELELIRNERTNINGICSEVIVSIYKLNESSDQDSKLLKYYLFKLDFNYLDKNGNRDEEKYYNIDYWYMILNEDKVNLREKPNLKSNVVKLLRKEDKLFYVDIDPDSDNVINQEGNWIKIRTEDNKIGYIWFSFLEKGIYNPFN